MTDKKVVSVMNMKGGVGKTTICAHLMYMFYKYKRKKLLLVDFDSQFNLTQALISRVQYEKLKDDLHTIMHVMEDLPSPDLFDVKLKSQSPPPVSEVNITLESSARGCVDLVPGNFDLVKYSLISDASKLDRVRNRFLRFISTAKEDYDLIVIDCNPSSSFITTCALHACEWLLVPVRPDRYSQLGLEILSDYIDLIPTLHPKPGVTVLLNGAQHQKFSAQTENTLRSHSKFGPLVLATKLPFSTLLIAKANETGFATEKGLPYTNYLLQEMRKIMGELTIQWKLT